ncbi:uncharacterized protein LOC117818562 [Xyrichtys novacula]|uniref:Uncharacterized protein LOC117818562 n=1 Tax=Xyrichtys novacula TaxID=13765 RepID=A0AAV1GAN8_XYRNO|nr:uncharacterized protein LOC117818562 [Xyrichtys novacula]
MRVTVARSWRLGEWNRRTKTQTDRNRLKTNGLIGEKTTFGHIYSDSMDKAMTSLLCFTILSSLAVSFQLGLEEVFFSPEDQTVREGEGVFFQCVSGESSAPASITWLKDERQVTRGRQIQGEYGGGNQKKTSGTLHLFNVTSEDDGIYVCVTRNPALNISKKSRPAKLTVLGIPRRLQIVQGPNNITVATGTEVSMHCAVRGFPVPMVHWFKDNILLTNCSSSFNLQNNGQLLTFRNVTKEDEGLYHCEASNQDELIRSQTAFLLPAEMDWSFVQQPTNQAVKRGDNVTVTCRPPYSRPAAQVSWFKNNKLFTPTSHVSMLPDGDLFFQSVRENDSGSYFCRASNVHLQRFLTSRRATLTVLAPPSVTVWPQVLTVPTGARVVLECQVQGHPLPSISWVKRGHSKQTGGRISLGLRNATLLIQSARSYDEGVYVCEAANSLGKSHSAATLRVAVSPIIVTFVAQVSCMVGASAVLPCRAVGILPIMYTWTKGRADTQPPIINTDGRHTDKDGALHISSVQYSDAGEYYCTAENRAGRHQRRFVLVVTAEHRPADRDKQTRLVLSARSNFSKEQAVSQSRDPAAKKHDNQTQHPHELAQHDVTCSSSGCDVSTNTTTTFPSFPEGAVAELKMSPSLGRLIQQQRSQPTTQPTQPLVTQMQPPVLPPPPHTNFHSVDLQSHLTATGHPLLISTEPTMTQPQTAVTIIEVLGTTFQYSHSASQSRLTSMPSNVQFQHQVSTKVLIESNSKGLDTHTVTGTSAFHLPSKLPFRAPIGSLDMELVSYSPSPSESPATQTTTHFSSLTPSSDHQLSLTRNVVPKFQLELTTSQHYLPPTQATTSPLTKPQESQVNDESSSGQLEPASTKSTLSQTQNPNLHSQAPQLQTETSPVQQWTYFVTPPTISATNPPDQTSNANVPLSLDPEIPLGHQVNTTDQVQVNTSKQGEPDQSAKSENETKLTEWLKRNTSQSPMTSNDPRVTQQAPSWLPVLEKHDIPIVVGVGVSLAFIFITVTFYSVVQKNEPAPTSRAAQRNLGVPMRHADRRAGGRTYENRAFEDDECVAVIEQSPNTADTRAQPPGPNLVTVQMEPTFEDTQEDMSPALDNHSITVETYPEPILDTKIDPSLEEEKGCSMSQPSIQLQCAEDWTSNRGDNHSPCQDALPPPSSLPSRSPSPSPPSRPEVGLRSSLTLQSAESCGAPIHHSLSISQGNPPLLLSHHVSLGLTTVAVDVHFYPAATASMAVGMSTSTNSTSVTAPLFGPTLANSQESEQSTARFK